MKKADTLDLSVVDDPVEAKKPYNFHSNPESSARYLTKEQPKTTEKTAKIQIAQMYMAFSILISSFCIERYFINNFVLIIIFCFLANFFFIFKIFV